MTAGTTGEGNCRSQAGAARLALKRLGAWAAEIQARVRPDLGPALPARAAGLLLALALPVVLAAQPRFEFASTPGKLARTVQPVRYELLLELDPARDSFNGQLALQVEASAPQREILLHASGLDAEAATLIDGTRRRPLRVQADAGAALWRLVPADGEPIAAGGHRLELRYRGRVQRSAEGLYRVEHQVEGRPARWLATQLQAVQARMLFPAFDEPVFRAVFALSVRAPAGLEVVSNMPRTELQRGRGTDLHRFAPTPPMPAYLLALAVGRFDVLEDSIAGLPLRILTAPGKRAQARFAMDETKRLLPYFETLFGQPYVLPKLDQLAVPGTREGGMEDWGLVSYAEDLLLYDPGRSAPATQRKVFGLLAHELSHQWFGNLVSIASWNELWLNEAFATWMEHKAAERFHPEWQSALRRRAGLDRVMARDATAATRPIRGPNSAVDETRVADVFDDITYTKGGAVLAMLEAWLGEATLRRGLAAYMKERRMQPATAGDLWHHIGVAAGIDVAAVAASWTDQPGFPLVEVDARCDGGRTRVQLRQRRFTLLPLPGAPRWQLPLRLARGAEQRALLLDSASQTVELPGCDGRALVVNAGGEGFFRVAYAPAWRARLLAQFAGLAAVDRLAMLSDSFALVQAGQLSMAAHFDLLRRVNGVADDSRPALFSLAAQQLAQLDEALAGSDEQKLLRAAGRRLLAPELQRLGWAPRAGEGSLTQQLRGELIERLAAFDDAAVIAEAQARFVDLLAGGRQGPPPSIRPAVLKAIGMHANDAEFGALLSALRGAADEEERWLFAGALAAGRDAGRARRLLDEALAGWMPPNLASILPGMVAANPAHAALTYGFSLRHFDALARLAGSAALGMRQWLLPGALGNSNDAALVQRMVEDQRRLAGAPGEAAAERVRAQVALRVALREREGPALGRWLADWPPTR